MGDAEVKGNYQKRGKTDTVISYIIILIVIESILTYMYFKTQTWVEIADGGDGTGMSDPKLEGE